MKKKEKTLSLLESAITDSLENVPEGKLYAASVIARDDGVKRALLDDAIKKALLDNALNGLYEKGILIKNETDENTYYGLKR